MAEEKTETAPKPTVPAPRTASKSEPASAEPEITIDGIYVPIQSPVTKESIPPAYKPNGEPYNP